MTEHGVYLLGEYGARHHKCPKFQTVFTKKNMELQAKVLRRPVVYTVPGALQKI